MSFDATFAHRIRHFALGASTHAMYSATWRSDLETAHYRLRRKMLRIPVSLSLGTCIAVVLFIAAPDARANGGDATPSNYRALLRQLEPGDVMRLAPGDYLEGLPIHRLNGRPGARIRIMGRDSGGRPRFVARRGHNTVSIVDSSYVEIAGLDLEGAGCRPTP